MLTAAPSSHATLATSETRLARHPCVLSGASRTVQPCGPTTTQVSYRTFDTSRSARCRRRCETQASLPSRRRLQSP